MDNNKILIQGIYFYKIGQCNRCGACEKPKCPHFKLVNSLAICDIYDKRDDFCDICFNDVNSCFYNHKKEKITHSNCKNFPDNPFCKVVRGGICGYKFIPVSEEDNKKYKEYLKIWQLPI